MEQKGNILKIKKIMKKLNFEMIFKIKNKSEETKNKRLNHF